MNYFPVIELSSLFDSDENTYKSVGEQICEASQQHGFFYIYGHGISETMVDSVFETARKFFALPDHVKSEVAISDYHRGFSGCRCIENGRIRPSRSQRELYLGT